MTAENLALDVIDEMRPGGHFLGEEHTWRHLTESWLAGLVDRQKVDDSEAAGSKPLDDPVQENLVDMFCTYHPPPVPEGVPDQIEEMLAEGEAGVGE